jgi:hypothetical protein
MRFRVRLVRVIVRCCLHLSVCFIRLTQAEAGSGLSSQADQHGQSGVDVHESRPVGGGGRITSRGTRAMNGEAGSQPSFYYEQHEQSSLYVEGTM